MTLVRKAVWAVLIAAFPTAIWAALDYLLGYKPSDYWLVFCASWTGAIIALLWFAPDTETRASERLRCGKCGKPHARKGQSYCARCHADYQVRYRKKLKRERQIVASFTPPGAQCFT